jgi:hypothetical protein
MKSGQIVGHLPMKISRLCSLFLLKGGSITVTVTGRRQYSTDLPQGGLEVPCFLTLTGPEALVEIPKNLVDILKLRQGESLNICEFGEESDRESEVSNETEEDIDPLPLDDTDDDNCVIEDAKCTDDIAIWARVGRHLLTVDEKTVICTKQQLTDNHMTFIQALIKEQFPKVNGLLNTLTLAKAEAGASLRSEGMQVIFCRDSHWIVASTKNCDLNCVNIFDSLYRNIDAATKATVAHLVGVTADELIVNMVKMGQQVGGVDCGVFAAAVLTSLAHGLKGPYSFRQVDMRTHLVDCIEQGRLLPFPSMQAHI